MLSIRAVIVGTAAATMTALGLGLAGAEASTAATGAPSCTPAALNTSAINAGLVTLSPLSGSRDASPETQISFLGVPAGELSHITVSGSSTGAHVGRLRSYSQGNGASFLPARPFAEGERVTVRAQLRAEGHSHALLDQFAIAEQDRITSTPEKIHTGGAGEVQGYRSLPELRPPSVTVTVSSPAVAPGDEFVAPYTGPGQAGPMILDSSGGLVWFKPLPTNTFATDFRVQEYGGAPALTWWQGDITVHGFGLGEGVIANRDYREIAHVRAGNGVKADLHDFQLTPRGTALITAYDPILCNLSSVGGSSYDGVTDGLFQEIDVKTGLVMYQWSSLDHVALRDSYSRIRESSTTEPYDYFHINSINVDQDGSLLISARNTWTVYDLDAASGQILWRLGGKHSSFTMGAGTQTAWQHDPRQLANGEFSVFDNGSSPTVHGQSRGIVIGLDAQNRTATLISQFIHTPPLIAESQGNLQALENGDWFAGWGQVPDFSEFSGNGALLFDAHFPHHTQSYRDFRFQWAATPAAAPVFAVQAAAKRSGTLYASWNGATALSGWRVFSGASPSTLKAVTQVPRTGFETAIALPAGGAGPFMTVQALNAAGAVIGTARTRKVS